MFWFDKQNPRALYLDRRRETHVLDVRPNRNPTVIDPDILGDFTALPFPDETFWHVIFDPPHTVTNSSAGWKRTKYGNLGDGWREMLRLGFAECFRVLATDGVLVVMAENGNARALPVSAGGFYAIRVRSVVAAGSTAYGLIFLG